MDIQCVGVISDTHGLVRPEALVALTGSDLIIHAGDIGAPEVLQQLEQVAPVVAIRGNNDRAPWAAHLRDTEVIEVNGALIYVLHNLRELDLDPRTAGFSVVIAGHSHIPSIEQHGAVLYLNPGSAGPRRFTLPISVAHLDAARQPFRARIVELDVPA